jgi:hypothetical protein
VGFDNDPEYIRDSNPLTYVGPPLVKAGV